MQTTTSVIEKEFVRLQSQAEVLKNTDPHDMSNMEVGDEWRQGDLRLIRLPNDFVNKNKEQLKQVEIVEQLAPGNTQGSRHILANTKSVKMFRLNNESPLDSVIFETKETNSIMHPEHGHLINIPKGCYATPGQRTFAQELRRVAD